MASFTGNAPNLGPGTSMRLRSECQLLGECRTIALAFNSLTAQEQLKYEQVHRTENHLRFRRAAEWVLYQDDLLPRRAVQSRIEDGCPSLDIFLAHGVEGELIQHLTRKVLFPQIAVFGVQHLDNPFVSHHQKIRSELWRGAIAGIVGIVVGEQPPLQWSLWFGC